MAKGQDEDSLWFRANRGKMKRHRMATVEEGKRWPEFAGKLICVTNLGGLNRARHVCDGQGPLITEPGQSTCRRQGCHARHGCCPPTV